MAQITQIAQMIDRDCRAESVQSEKSVVRIGGFDVDYLSRQGLVRKSAQVALGLGDGRDR